MSLGEPGIIIDSRLNPGIMALMSLIDGAICMSREMQYVALTHKDFLGLFNRMHDIPGFNVGLLN